MRNDNKISSKLTSLAEKLPCFTIKNLMIADIKENYLRIFLSRQVKKGRFIRLKKGLYTSKKVIDDARIKGNYSVLLEFLSNKIYSPSYLSLDYILYQYNLLTEIPANFTLATKNKTKIFSNILGNFIYHKIKDDLFFGFDVIKNNDFVIYKASKIKALFDFLYLRKNLLKNKNSIEELRLNIESLYLKEKKELKKYILKEGSLSMEKIYLNLFKE